MITGERIVQNLMHIGAGPMARMILNTKYAVVDAHSMEDFWLRYYEILNLINVLPFKENAMDCDAFAILAWALMKIAYRRTDVLEGRDTDMAPNMGIFAFEREAMGEGHMINFVPTDTGVVFYEPQPQNGKCGNPVHMTTDQVLSCFAYAI